MITHAMWPSLQLMFWGRSSRSLLAIGVGVYSAVKQYSVGDYCSPGSRTSGIAMPPFLFGLLAIALLVTLAGARSSTSSQPIFYSVGLHSEGQSGFNLDYLRHLALPVLDADRAERRGVEPLPARVDARRPERRLRPHRAGQGRAASAR